MLPVRLSFAFFILFFVVLSAWAQPVIQTFNTSTFSRLTGPLVGDAIDVNNIIYGGLSGANCASSNASTCNSCTTATPGQACNTRRIHNDLMVTLSFRAHQAGFLLVTTNLSEENGQQRLTIEGPFQSDSGGLPAPEGTLIEVQIPWREICNKVFNSPGAGGCETLTQENFKREAIRIGLSPGGNFLNEGDFITNLFIEIQKIDDSEGQVPLCNIADSTVAQGLCNFSVFPGDGKAFIDNVRGNCSLPNLGSGRARMARIFFKEVPETLAERTFPDITTPNPVDLRILSNTGSGNSCTIPLGESSVGGLTNSRLYSFAIGLVDQANNVGYVTNMSPGAGSTSLASLDTDVKTGCFNPADPNQSRNCHLVRPDEVLALFQDEFDCFITTAAYGSPTHYQVQTFRQFRNHYLKTNWLGQKIINFYYRTSPPLASWIRQHPRSQFWVRMALWPLWVFAKLTLVYPLAFFLFLGVLMFPLLLKWRARP